MSQLPAPIRELALNRIRIEFDDRARQFRRRVAELRSAAASVGASRSSGLQIQITDAIRIEYEVRAMLAWQVLGRVLSGDGLLLSSEVNAAIKQFIDSAMRELCTDIDDEYERGQMIMPGSPITSKDLLLEKELARVHSEIDISLRAASRAQVASGTTTVNIYQPFGIVQTGPGSSASFSQHFGPVEREEALRALTEVDRAITQSSTMSPEQRSEITEVIADTRAEIQRQGPNMMKVRGALSAIASTVQTLGSGDAAYKLLKGVAAYFGLHLP